MTCFQLLYEIVKVNLAAISILVTVDIGDEIIFEYWRVVYRFSYSIYLSTRSGRCSVWLLR